MLKTLKIGICQTWSLGKYSMSTITFPTNDSPKYMGRNYGEILQIRDQHANPNMSQVHLFKTPLLIHSGKMQWLYDHTGKRYLDMYGCVATASVGHCNPKVNEALKKQIDKLWHTTLIHMNPAHYEYIEKLATRLPTNLQTIMLTGSGSEGNDLAMLLARLYTKNTEIITFKGSYHGNTQQVMGLTSQAKNKFKIAGLNTNVHHAMNPDPYSGIWGGKYCRDSISQTDRNCNCDQNVCEASTKYFNEFKSIFEYSVASKNCAAMFFEPIQGYNGAVQYTKGFLKKAAGFVKDQGGLVIADEVQSGFGRTGEHFWAFESHGIEPDIIVMSKGIGNGFPFGAVATSKPIAEVLTKAAYFSTFSGSALGCAAALAVLNVIEEDKLQENAYNLGKYMLEKLCELRTKYEIVGDVRGKGFMLGIELVENKMTRKSLDIKIVNDILEDCKDNCVIFGKGGIRNNIIRIKPPLIISKSDVDMSIDILDMCLKKYDANNK